MPAAYDMVYGRDRPSGAPRYDHYSSELILLYVVKIASEELKALKRMSRRPPTMRLAGWEGVDARIRLGDELAQHLWFPGDTPPHRYDFVDEANSRGMRGERLVDRDKRLSPEQLKASQVRYYRNPLVRLIKMHSSFNEMTGFSSDSPWPRSDSVIR